MSSGLPSPAICRTLRNCDVKVFCPGAGINDLAENNDYVRPEPSNCFARSTIRLPYHMVHATL